MTLIEISLETGVASVEKTVVLSKTASDVNPACSIMAVFKHEVCGRTRNVEMQEGVIRTLLSQPSQCCCLRLMLSGN